MTGLKRLNRVLGSCEQGLAMDSFSSAGLRLADSGRRRGHVFETPGSAQPTKWDGDEMGCGNPGFFKNIASAHLRDEGEQLNPLGCQKSPN